MYATCNGHRFVRLARQDEGALCAKRTTAQSGGEWRGRVIGRSTAVGSASATSVPRVKIFCCVRKVKLSCGKTGSGPESVSTKVHWTQLLRHAQQKTLAESVQGCTASASRQRHDCHRSRTRNHKTCVYVTRDATEQARNERGFMKPRDTIIHHLSREPHHDACDM